jgi:hypothetical protein
MTKPKKQKVKIHFNRPNMQRGLPTVWSAHTATSCNPSEKVIVVHNGVVVLETVYKPDGQQPRGYLSTRGVVTTDANGVTTIEV